MKPSGYTGVVDYMPRAGEQRPDGRCPGPGRCSASTATAACRGWKKTAARGRSSTTTRASGSTAPTTLTYKSNGDLYFTDPPYGLPKQFDDPRRELDFCGVYRLAKDGQVTLLTKDMTRPNGIAFSPDEKTLYVAQSDPAAAIWMAFEVKADGTLGKSRLFFDATSWAKAGKKGLPDGMKVDAAGNLFATGPGGVHIFTPDGTHLGHPRNRRSHGQLRLGRRRQNALHHGRHVPGAHQAEHQGQRLVTVLVTPAATLLRLGHDAEQLQDLGADFGFGIDFQIAAAARQVS